MAVMTPKLDLAFHALSNSTRRAVVERLRAGPATVSELAGPFKMALPSFMQHLEVLETSGLVQSSKRGRVRTVRVVPDQLRRASGWLEQQRVIWERRLDQLDEYVKGMEKSS
jgi:DNA-binding transcriptional ArsR family regulator